jgi:hypothetical protein
LDLHFGVENALLPSTKITFDTDASMSSPASPAAMTARLEKQNQPNGAIQQRYDAGLRHVDHCNLIWFISYVIEDH